MAYQANILSQILKKINRYEFKKQVSKYNGDYKTSRFSCFNLLSTMIFTHLKANSTIRDIVIGFGLMLKNYYHLGLKSVKRSTLSDALKLRDHRIYEDYYKQLLHSLNRKQRRQFGKKLNIIDASTISLCLEKYNWAKYKSTKGGIKLHVMIDGDTLIPEKVIITDAMVHDITGIKNKIDFAKDQIYVYDRGYVCYNYLYDIELNGAFFVTRLKSNANYEIIEQKVLDGDDVLFDETIKITGTKANDYSKPLRLITFYHKESDKFMKFLTNNFEMSPETIAGIYKSRWQIELFFKWIKQHLKIKTFLSTTKNGVKIQIWCALITYLLLNIIKQKYKIDIGIFEIFRRVNLAINKKLELFELLTSEILSHIKPEIEKKHGQLELNYA